MFKKGCNQNLKLYNVAFVRYLHDLELEDTTSGTRPDTPFEEIPED